MIANEAGGDLLRHGAPARLRLRVPARLAWRTCLALASLLALLTGVAAGGAGGDPELFAIVAPARGAIVLLTSCHPQGAGRACRWSTAWSPAPHLYLTALHTLQGSTMLSLSLRGRPEVAARVLVVDPGHDLAVLRSDLSIPLLPAATAVQPGQELVAVCSRRAIAYQGHPGGTAVYAGRLGGAPIHETGGEDVYAQRVAGAASVRGCSGGPVLDTSGAVAGITVAGDGSSAGMVPLSVALDLLRRAARETV